ncbi:MAG: dephospho-CoA kinase [Thermoclostridium sp.]|nr:dephospho-CoA kinase [Thermoclostridium sp.]
MLTIGITGGIGSGKSTAAQILKEYGARVILADEIAKDIMEPHMPAWYRIVEHFGTGILEDTGRIDRKKLGELVFNNKQELLALNEITHSTVAERIKEILDEYRREQVKLAVVEAIVPIEHGFLDAVDTVWVVLASEPVRVKRIMKRNNFSRKEAVARIRAQMPDEKYKSIAKQIIYNDGTVDALRLTIRGLLANEQNSPT